MKTVALLAAASVLLASSLLSGLMVPSVSAQARTQDSALPPPAMHDPGARAVAPAPTASVRSPAASRSALPSMQDAGAARDGLGALPPEVSVHQSGTDSVQEYRRNGQLYMVVVTPRTGIAQTYMVDPQGRLVDEHGQKPVRPVMYKVLEWGKSKPAAAATSGGPNDGGH